MAKIIDFHTHAFPDALAKTAIPILEEEGDVQAFHDGRITSLLGSMDEVGVDKSVVCSIATKPAQYPAIYEWSKEIQSKRVIPFPSIHPADPLWEVRLDQIKNQGFLGIKMHPYYQTFFLDEKRMMPIYEKISSLGLILVMHCGFDIAFPESRRVTPPQIVKILETFPNLKFIATHMGSWKLWDEVENHLVGKSIYMDISYSFDFMPEEQAKRIIQNHPSEYILFGTDSPWDSQKHCIEQLKAMNLGDNLTQAILGKNGARLLMSSSN